MVHRLKIAASCFCIALGMLLAVMWVRSYWRYDVLFTGNADAGSNNGAVYIMSGDRMHGGMLPLTSWRLRTRDTSGWKPSFVFTRSPNLRIQLPYASLTLPILAAAVVPWLPLRFRLRTLLIATTVGAAISALIAYLVKSSG